jgi:tRNA (guanine10-N2)-methyltransferase
MRGKDEKSVKSNFKQYNLKTFFLDAMTFDLTQNPIRKGVFFDAIVCDRIHFMYFSADVFIAPYGVRAGAKRLGSRKDVKRPLIRKDGTPAHA